MERCSAAVPAARSIPARLVIMECPLRLLTELDYDIAIDTVLRHVRTCFPYIGTTNTFKPQHSKTQLVLFIRTDEPI